MILDMSGNKEVETKDYTSIGTRRSLGLRICLETVKNQAETVDQDINIINHGF